MARARDMLRAFEVALVCLLVLSMAPVGVALERGPGPSACESWCPCDAAAHDEAHDDDHDEHERDSPPCEQDCDEDCSDCCDARLAVAVVASEGLPATRLRAVRTRGLSPPEARGSGVATGVFRPPRRLI